MPARLLRAGRSAGGFITHPPPTPCVKLPLAVPLAVVLRPGEEYRHVVVYQFFTAGPESS